MANPNIVTVTSILGETVGAVATISFADLVSNPASSGKVYKINSLIATNTDVAQDVDISVNFVSGGNSYAIGSAITIPYNAMLVAISRDHGIYLREDEKIQVKAGSTLIQFVCSYEIIS